LKPFPGRMGRECLLVVFGNGIWQHAPRSEARSDFRELDPRQDRRRRKRALLFLVYRLIVVVFVDSKGDPKGPVSKEWQERIGTANR